MGKGSASRGRITTIALLVGLAACASTPPPAPPFTGPDATIEVSHFGGSPLSGPRAREAVLDPAGFDAVRVSVVALERFPADLLDLVSTASDLIVAPPDAETLLAAGRLGRNARFGSGPESLTRYDERRESGDLGRTLEISSLRGALAPGVTARIAITALTGRSYPDRPGTVRPRLSILLRGEGDTATSGPLRLALVLDGIVGEEAETDEPVALIEQTEDLAPALPRRRVVREETVLLRLEPVDGAHRLVLLVPTPFDPGGDAGIAVRIDVEPPPAEDSPTAEEHGLAVARCRREVTETAASALTDAKLGVPPPAVWPGLGSTLGSGDTPPPRRALAYLARTTGAPLAEDVALAAPADVVDALGEVVFAALRESATWPDRVGQAWILESAAYRLLVEREARDGPTPFVDALLVRHAGEVGRHGDLVVELIGAADGVESLTTYLVEENRIFLEDNAPASRLRAYDWLANRGHAPAGFDPLGPRKERQAALRKAMDAAAEGEAR